VSISPLIRPIRA